MISLNTVLWVQGSIDADIDTNDGRHSHARQCVYEIRLNP